MHYKILILIFCSKGHSDSGQVPQKQKTNFYQQDEISRRNLINMIWKRSDQTQAIRTSFYIRFRPHEMFSRPDPCQNRASR